MKTINNIKPINTQDLGYKNSLEDNLDTPVKRINLDDHDFPL